LKKEIEELKKGKNNTLKCHFTLQKESELKDKQLKLEQLKGIINADNSSPQNSEKNNSNDKFPVS